MKNRYNKSTSTNELSGGKRSAKTNNEILLSEKRVISPLLNREQAAAYLGISEKSVWTHTRRGLLPFVRLGGLVRYRRQALDETLAKLETRSTARK